MTSAHAPLAPSSAPQWGNCSGSVMMQMQFPDREHPRTRGGTASHWVFSEALTAYRDTELGVACCEDWIGKTAPNGVVVDEEMAEGAQVMVDHCLDIAQRVGTAGMLIEHRVKMPKIHPHNWGTLDFALVNYSEEWIDYATISARRQKIVEIYLSDYKFGHREVKAEMHLQLIDYVEGLVEELAINGYEDQQVIVHMAVVQPFAYKAVGPVDTWTVRLSQLRQHFNHLHSMAIEVFTAPKCTSGPWCRDCTAVGKCETAKLANYSLIEYVNRPLVIENMTSAELGLEREILSSGVAAAKSRLEAIEAEIQHRIGNGETGSGLTLQTSLGHLTWKVPAQVAVILCKQFGVDAAKNDVITPTQAKAKIGKELRGPFEKALAAITEKPTRGTKLVKLADAMTARAFKKV